MLYWWFIIMCYILFCCKQKTAYEMRISYWSSDVCSSDLLGDLGQQRVGERGLAGADATGNEDVAPLADGPLHGVGLQRQHHLVGDIVHERIDARRRFPDREAGRPRDRRQQALAALPGLRQPGAPHRVVGMSFDPQAPCSETGPVGEKGVRKATLR